MAASFDLQKLSLDEAQACYRSNTSLLTWPWGISYNVEEGSFGPIMGPQSADHSPTARTRNSTLYVDSSSELPPRILSTSSSPLYQMTKTGLS